MARRRPQQFYLAGKEIAPPAMIAIPAVAAVPTNPNPLASSPRLHAFANSINNSNDFVSRYTRILNTGPKSFLD